MKIIEALKKENIIITSGSRWLFWDDVIKEWVVLEREYHKKKNTTLISTENEEEAVNKLLEV